MTDKISQEGTGEIKYSDKNISAKINTLYNMFSLNGKLALVTGASGGIGGAIAKALYTAGADVIITGRDTAKLELIKSEMLEISEPLVHTPLYYANQVYPIACNLMDPEQSEKLIKQTYDLTGRHIDILVNNAGIHQLKMFHKISKDQLHNIMEMNFTVPFMLSQALIDSMVKNKFGRIINITSSATHGAAGQAHYNTSKAALDGLTKSLAANPHYAQNGVTVNSVSPGVITTELSKNIRGKAKEQNLMMTPMGRFGKPEEVAGIVAFLASDAASYINAQIIYVDGGMVR